MMAPERPANEDARLRALLETEVLDTPPEPAFDDLTRLATAICGTPMASVTLIDAERQWFKSRVGLDDPWTPRDVAFCAHAILDEDVLLVPDAAADPRFADNPLVLAGPRIRFYAGAPIRLGTGEQVGAVCVLDRVARELSADRIEALRSLARMAATNLDLRRSSRALGRATEQLADLLDSTNDLVQSVSPDGRILFTNRAWKRAMGYADEELGRLRLAEIVAPESQAALAARFAELAAGAKEGPVEAVLVRRDGRRVFVEGTASGKMEGDRLAWIRTVLRDVTDRVTAERDRHAFLTRTAEEMRAPLTAVRGALDVLGDDALPDGAREVREVAVANTETLLRQVQNVLDLERLTAGAYEIERAGVRVEELLQAAGAEARKLAGDRAVGVDAEAPPGAMVRGDREPLQQAVFNLLACAVRRSPPGHRVRVRVTAQPRAMVRLSFTDEGDAIPPDELPHLFEAPTRRLPSIRSTGSAMGMALAVTKAIATAHGGDVGAESGRARGATLWLDLPSG